uniref:BACK domain-containing protein n=1 Tax=Macrostomum lignano TaxID=282301 RepID=A0A1I8FIZ4_9PLAT
MPGLPAFAPHCRLREIDVFRARAALAGCRDQQQQCMEQLLTEIRYNLIAPSDLVSKVQLAPAVMANARLHSLLLQHCHAWCALPAACTPPDMVCCAATGAAGLRWRPRPSADHARSGRGRSALLLPKPSQGATAAVAAAESPLMSAGQESLQLCPSSHPRFPAYACCVDVTQCAQRESAVNACRFDLRFNAWYQCAPMLQRRAYFAAGIVMVNRRPRIMVVAGRRKEGALQHCELYDPEANCWTAGPCTSRAATPNENFYPDVHKLRPAAQFWEECAPMLAAPRWHCMVEAAGRLYVCGGCSLNAANNALPVLQCEQYNAEADQWTIVSPMPVSHKEACAVAVDRHVYVLGGFNVHTKTGQRLVCRLDLDSHQWETVGSFSHSTTGVCASSNFFSRTSNTEIQATKASSSAPAPAPLSPAVTGQRLTQVATAAYHKNVLTTTRNPRNVGSLDKASKRGRHRPGRGSACGERHEAADRGQVCGRCASGDQRTRKFAKELRLPPVKLHCSHAGRRRHQGALKDFKVKNADEAGVMEK